jgi:hypothetical protein
MFLFPAGAQNYTAEAHYWELHPFDVMYQLGIQTDNLKLNTKFENPVIHKKQQLTLSTNRTKRSKQNTFDDAWLSLDFALKNSVYMDNAKLTNSTKAALREWLDLLKNAMPPSWNIQRLIKALLNNFDSITSTEQELLQVLKQHPPPTKRWSASCTHGEPSAGYTCGLWELFHIMTVGVVEWNMMISTDDGGMVYGTEDVAKTLRNFVANFFGCEVCRKNFVEAFDDCRFDRCTRLLSESYKVAEWMQLPVWLWEMHNAVNVRLLQEKGQREKFRPSHQQEIDKQYPLREECLKCWDKDGGYDDQVIYKWLRIEYWPEDFVSDKYRDELFGDTLVEDKVPETSLSHRMPLLIQLLPIFALAGAVAGYKVKQMERRRSGKHKKDDESNGSVFANGV